MTLILGVGAGTFAVLFAAAVAILIVLVGFYFAPDMGLFILLGGVALPLIVFGCILTAPSSAGEGAADPSALQPAGLYRDPQLPVNTDLVDRFLPVRIVIFLLMLFGVFAGVGFCALDIMSDPPFSVPRMRCLRQQLEEAHPSWYQ